MLHSGRPDGYLDFFNKRWLECVGLSLDDMCGWRWTEVIHPDDVVEEVGRWRSSLATGEPFEAEARVRRADGEYRWMLHRNVPARDDQGRIIKWYGSSVDIEDRWRAELALLEARDKLAHVTRTQAMGELAAAIAHEVNQPLTAIVTNGNFSLRQLERANPNPDELRAAIAEIVNDGTRASAVISRIRGLLMRGALKRTELDINRVIRDVGIFLRNELSRNRVSLRTDLASDLPPVQGDPVQLQQVLINLIMNAVEAMRSSTGRTRELLIRSGRSPEGVVVQVQDSGPGIEAELTDRIFEPFFTTKVEGIGMGLSISRSIIESHGGQLSFVSASQGAVFQFTLPADVGSAS
jgi:PAS domain S-box-containing protein